MMSCFIYCNRPSESAVELSKALGAVRLRNFDGLSFWKKRKKVHLKDDDTLICWGASFPEVEGLRVMNGVDTLNKYEQAHCLTNHGIPTVYARSYKFEACIGRTFSHTCGNDLLTPPDKPQFFVKKEVLTKEFRVHIFDGRSIRAGEKVMRNCPRVEMRIPCRGCGYSPSEAMVGGYDFAPEVKHLTVHPWVRSFEGGWRLQYNGFKSSKEMRTLAKSAVKALGLTFGAVDIGMRSDGSLMVLEVNRAPGIEGGSIEAYVKAIEKWLNKDEVKEVEE